MVSLQNSTTSGLIRKRLSFIMRAAGDIVDINGCVSDFRNRRTYACKHFNQDQPAIEFLWGQVMSCCMFLSAMY